MNLVNIALDIIVAITIGGKRWGLEGLDFESRGAGTLSYLHCTLSIHVYCIDRESRMHVKHLF